VKYMGSKNRISKYILPIILKDRKEGQWYIEPFVGGGNTIDKVTGNRIGNDIDLLANEALIAIRDRIEYLPMNNTEFTEKDYKLSKAGDAYLDIQGYVAYSLSYGGKKWGGWRRDSLGKRDYVNEAFKNANNQHDKIRGVTLFNVDYQELVIPSDSIIYCDPPYTGTTKYSNAFNHNDFWQWCRNKRSEGHQVFISEYEAPSDFKCIWEKRVVSSLTRNTGSKKGLEKLFTI